MTERSEVVAVIQGRFPAVLPRASVDHPAVNVPAAEAVAVLRFLRDECGFDFLVDVTGIDGGPGQSPRFTVVWHLYGSGTHDYVRVAAECADDVNPAMATATGLWPAANWHERECWDLLGIKFDGHPDLRRILMWEGYPYFPLRKEFPLAGLPADLPDEQIAAETRTGLIAAPMAGGPFVATPGELMTDAEPRAKDEAWNEKRTKPE